MGYLERLILGLSHVTKSILDLFLLAPGFFGYK